MKSFFLYSVGAALLFALAVAGCGRDTAASKQNQPQAEAPLAVTVTPVRTQKVTRTVDFVGTLFANEEVTVSSELDGKIASLAVDLGDRVAQGQTLAKIDDAEFRYAIKQTESNLRENLAKLGLDKTPPQDFDVKQTSLVTRAKADFDDAELSLKRMKTLHEKNLVAAQDYDTAQTRAKVSGANYQSSIEEARASLAAAYSKEAQLDTARKKLRDTVIGAPLAGSISKRAVSAGEYVKVGAPLFTIVQDNPLKLRGMIPERFAPDIHTDEAVEIKVDSFPNDVFKGKLTRISPSSDVTSRSFLVEGLVENPDRRLKPGFFAHAAVTTKVDPNAMTVPQQALVSFAGVTKVFVAENNVARERVVEAAGRVGANEVEVVGGLRPGELVIVSGLTRVANGTKLKVSGPVMPREGVQQP
ncbi:MAG TPA: efflux RND transporter periplasmic adaptor subunit [Verrucomicrobiae bacterium]|jgi:RND family efflux transporter MFP subunit|nr:efflux RND transporter periplasmic adaptor subunit [Verrucomicrobiae bacterium]